MWNIITFIVVIFVAGHLENQNRKSREWFEKSQREEREFYETRRKENEDRRLHHTNERLLRLERVAEKNGWILPRCSFGFLTSEDLYPNSDIDE